MHRLYQRDKSLPQPRQLLFYHSNLDFGFLDEQGRYVFCMICSNMMYV